MDGYGYDQLQCDAVGFVLEAETWPVFLSWARENATSDESRERVESAALDVQKWRVEWMRHSPDPDVRALAVRLFGEPQ